MQGTLSQSVALTTTPTASTTTAKPDGRSKHIVDVYWTPGVTGNILTVLVEFRPNINTGNAGWIQSHTWSSTAGARTKTNDSYTYTASGTSEQAISIPIFEHPAQEFRIKISEDSTGGVGKGTYTAYWTSF